MKNIIVFMSSIFLTIPAFAGEVFGEIVFTGSPAKAGVLYEMKANHEPVNGVINQKDKEFTQMIGVASSNANIEFVNNDSFEHSIFANDSSTGINFDLGLMAPGTSQPIVLDWASETIIRVGCLIHPKMRSYIANVSSDNFLPFEFDKKIKTIPFKLEITDENSNLFVLLLAGMDRIEVTLAPGESKTIPIIKRSKEKGSLTIGRN